MAGPQGITTTWEGFQPYLAAHLWPVQAHEGAEIELFACSDINGADRLPGPAVLRQAGFLVAAGFSEDKLIFSALKTLVQRQNRGPSRSVSGLTQEIETFLDLPEVRMRGCEILAEVHWFTGLSIEGCQSATPGLSPASVTPAATSPTALAPQKRGP